MAVTYNTGTLRSYDVTASTTSAGVGQAPDRRRRFDFGDDVAEITPDKTPFLTYLVKVSKDPTPDPVFRYLENRASMEWTSREFYLAADVNSGSAVTAGSSYNFTIDDGTSASIDWLILGMVFSVNTVYGTAGYSQVIVRVATAPVDTGATTTFQGTIIDVSETTPSGYNVCSDNDRCQLIGTAFQEGTGAPDVWSTEIEDNYGYTQIFKTACELTNTARATEFRGYKDEMARLWAEKLDDHTAMIERAMLFSQKARRNSIQHTEGLVGHILKNSTMNTDASALTYSSGVPYARTVTEAELTYDLILGDFEVLFDPARGGGSKRLGMASFPIISFFNKVGDGAGFADVSVGFQYAPWRMDISAEAGKFGHKVMRIETIHGTVDLVKQPMFRGNSRGFLLLADLTNVAYRPLVGNGINRDTHILPNVQNNDEDLRKDMIITEAGLEVKLPEGHLLYNVEGY